MELFKMTNSNKHRCAIAITIHVEQEEEINSVYPFVEYKNWTFLSTTPVKNGLAEKHFQLVKNFETRENDVLLCSSQKSGTHWMHEILSMLLTQSTEYNLLGHWWDLNFECIEKFDMIEQMKHRIFSTHLPFSFLPKKHIEKGYKIIYLNRNPKDRCVSLYNFFQGLAGVPVWTWAEYFDNYVLKDTLYTGWFNYTKEMNAGMKTANIFPIMYEDLLLEPRKNITAIANFLQVPFTDAFIDDIVTKCSFENLKENKIDVSKVVHPERKSKLWRKGKIGDWKNWFTIAQNEQFDDLYKKEMENLDLKFT